MNEHPSPEFEKEIRESFDAPKADPTFVLNLRATLLERTKMKNKNRKFIRFAWAGLIVVCLIVVLIASPRVVTALKQLLGYIPGIGYVEQGNFLRVLSAPVTVQKDGLTLTIEKGAADSQQTVLLQHLEGYTTQMDGTSGCNLPASLVLPDGTVLNLISFETGYEGDKGGPLTGSYYGRYIFEAMPAQALQATLEIPCVMFDSNYPDWQIDLQFEQADESQIAPVIEIPTIAYTESITPQTDLPTAPASSTESTIEGFSIVLESETSLPDGYILAGSYQWTDPRFDGFSVSPSEIQITDSNGREVTVQQTEPITRNTDPAIKNLPFAFQIIGKDYAFPLTISVKSIVATLTDTATFQFDAGANPQVGQVWEVNAQIPINQYLITIQTIKLISGRTPTELGFEFTVTSIPAIAYVSILDLNPVFIGDSGGGGGGGGGGSSEIIETFTTSWVLDNYSPAGAKTFTISDIGIVAYGLWQATWQPSSP